MKVVLPAAGLGTRLLPATKEQPKEMLSIFTLSEDEEISVKPLLQNVFEQLYDAGFSDFCFVVGRGKRTIEDHFTPDQSYIELLRKKKKDRLAKELEGFYKRVKESTTVWINQPEPKGFGDAVLKAEPFVDEDRILVHAGDTYVISDDNSHLDRLIKAHEKFDSDATLILQEVKNPKKYGVAEIEKTSEDGVYEVKKAIEKPEKPPTNLAIMPIYIFEPSIFEALKETSPGKGNEIQLTDGFSKMIEEGKDVRAIKLKPEEKRWDIGTSKTYWEALKQSYNYTREKINSSK